jgi:hypothetical protein
MKQGDVKIRGKGDWTAVVWKCKQNVNILTSLHYAPAEGIFL